MAKTSPKTEPPPQGARLFELADHVIRDLRRRNLKPGDSYLSTAATARMLRINTTTANRVLQLVANRRLIKRSQGKGSVVLGPQEAEETTLDRVHLLVPKRYYQSEGLLADGVVIGVQKEIPNASIQFSFTPQLESERQVGDLVTEALRLNHRSGFVLVRGSLESQRLLEDSQLPTVVYGAVYPSIERLSCIDRDQANLAKLLATHMFKGGARRLLMFFRNDMGAGDYTALNSFHAVATQYGLRPSDLFLACMPADRGAVASVVQQFMNDTSEPGGIFCRSRPLADLVTGVLGSMKRGVNDLPMVSVGDVYEAEPHAHPYVCVRPTLSPVEIGQRIGQMLIRQVREPDGGPYREAISEVISEVLEY